MWSWLWILVTGENKEIMANVSATSWAAGPRGRYEEMKTHDPSSIICLKLKKKKNHILFC